MKKIKAVAVTMQFIGYMTYCYIHPDNNKFAKDLAKADARYAK